jgi:hypothetical protein
MIYIHICRIFINSPAIFTTVWLWQLLPCLYYMIRELSYDSFKSKISGWLLDLREDVYVRDFLLILETNFSFRFRYTAFCWLLILVLVSSLVMCPCWKTGLLLYQMRLIDIVIKRAQCSTIQYKDTRIHFFCCFRE